MKKLLVFFFILTTGCGIFESESEPEPEVKEEEYEPYRVGTWEMQSPDSAIWVGVDEKSKFTIPTTAGDTLVIETKGDFHMSLTADTAHIYGKGFWLTMVDSSYTWDDFLEETGGAAGESFGGFEVKTHNPVDYEHSPLRSDGGSDEKRGSGMNPDRTNFNESFSLLCKGEEAGLDYDFDIEQIEFSIFEIDHETGERLKNYRTYQFPTHGFVEVVENWCYKFSDSTS